MPGQRKKFPPEFWLEYFKYESQRGRLWEKQGKSYQNQETNETK